MYNDTRVLAPPLKLSDILVHHALALVVFTIGVRHAIAAEEMHARGRPLWASVVTAGWITRLGLAEMLVALGLILPIYLNIPGWIVLASAAGLVVFFAAVLRFHLRRAETRRAILTAAFLASALFVLLGKIVVYPPE